MPRQRRGRDVEARANGGEVREEGRYLIAWGLQPAQWRPVGSMALVRTRAILLWRVGGDEAADSDVALRARRAYDRLGELGVTVSADSTREGIEVTVPLARAALALRILADRSIMPDALLVGEAPADQLRTLRRDVGAFRGRVELVIGHEGAPDALAELRSRVRAG